jgi:hypothetical protein
MMGYGIIYHLTCFSIVKHINGTMVEGETEMATIKPPSTTASKLVDVEAQIDPEEDAETRRLRDIERTLWTRIWQGVAITTVVFNILAMVWERGAASVLAGFIAIPVSAAVFYYQFEIQDTDCECLLLL